MAASKQAASSKQQVASVAPKSTVKIVKIHKKKLKTRSLNGANSSPKSTTAPPLADVEARKNVLRMLQIAFAPRHDCFREFSITMTMLHLMSTVEEHSSGQIELRTSKPRAVLKADFSILFFSFSYFLFLSIPSGPFPRLR